MKTDNLINILNCDKIITSDQVYEILNFNKKESEIFYKGYNMGYPLENIIDCIKLISRYDMWELSKDCIKLTGKKSWKVISKNFKILKLDNIIKYVLERDDEKVLEGLFYLASEISKNNIPIYKPLLFSVISDIKNINVFKEAILKLYPYFELKELLIFTKYENEEIGKLIIEDCIKIKEKVRNLQIFKNGRLKTIEILETLIPIDTVNKYNKTKILLEEFYDLSIIQNFAKLKTDEATNITFSILKKYYDGMYLSDYLPSEWKEDAKCMNQVMSILNTCSSDEQLMRCFDTFVEKYKFNMNYVKFDRNFGKFLDTISKSEKNSRAFIMDAIINLKQVNIEKLSQELIDVYLDALVLLSRKENIDLDCKNNKIKTLLNHIQIICNEVSLKDIEKIKTAINEIINSEYKYDEFLNVYQENIDLALEAVVKYEEMYGGKSIDIKPNTMVITNKKVGILRK